MRAHGIKSSLLAGAAVVALGMVLPLAVSVAPAVAQERVVVSTEFRTALEPYGQFQRHGRWGEVWVPARLNRDWKPYTVGRWVYSEDFGWYWESDDQEAAWGWVVFHYGRWVYEDDLGWAWVPGRKWSPAWVDWRRGDRHIGWAALPPDEIVTEVADSPRFWVFVAPNNFVATRISRVVIAPQPVFFQQTVIVNRTVVLRKRNFAVNPGIPPAVIAAAVGRPINAYNIRPRVFAGTADIQGAFVVRANGLRRQDFGRTIARSDSYIWQTGTTIRPAQTVPAPQPLARGEQGRLGDAPPRAARGETRPSASETQGVGDSRQREGATRDQRPDERDRAIGRDDGDRRGGAASRPRERETQGRGDRTPDAAGREQRDGAARNRPADRGANGRDVDRSGARGGRDGGPAARGGRGRDDGPAAGRSGRPGEQERRGSAREGDPDQRPGASRTPGAGRSGAVESGAPAGRPGGPQGPGRRDARPEGGTTGSGGDGGPRPQGGPGLRGGRDGQTMAPQGPGRAGAAPPAAQAPTSRMPPAVQAPGRSAPPAAAQAPRPSGAGAPAAAQRSGGPAGAGAPGAAAGAGAPGRPAGSPGAGATTGAGGPSPGPGGGRGGRPGGE